MLIPAVKRNLREEQSLSVMKGVRRNGLPFATIWSSNGSYMGL